MCLKCYTLKMSREWTVGFVTEVAQALAVRLCWIFNSKEQNDEDQQKRPRVTGSDEVGLLSVIQEVGGLDLPCHRTVLTRLAQQ